MQQFKSIGRLLDFKTKQRFVRRFLMPAKLPAWERKQLAIRAKLLRMLKKTPKKITGRHLYVGEHLRRAAIE
eukprot:2276601-Amphidinium_carterae.2